MRDAGLSPQAWVTMETWLEGSYEYSEVVGNLKKLERPLLSQRGTKITGMHGLVETGHSSYYPQPESEPGYGVSATFAVESLYLLPESLDKD